MEVIERRQYRVRYPQRPVSLHRMVFGGEDFRIWIGSRRTGRTEWTMAGKTAFGISLDEQPRVKPACVSVAKVLWQTTTVAPASVLKHDGELVM